MSPENQTLPPLGNHSSPQWLRKRRRNSERARVTRACDRCKKRKIKCNGTRPCEHCTHAEARCAFTCAYSRGRAPVILQAPDREEVLAQEARQIEEPRSEPDPSSHTVLPPNTAYAAAASSQGSPEPSQTDLQGHYVGPSSGVSFLLRVQKRLHQAISFSRDSTIFTFGDAPLDLPDFDPSFCMMLPRGDAQRLVDRYFDFAMPTYRFLHRPTTQEWFDEFYDTLGVMRDAHGAPVKVALLFMVFALARLYMPDDDRPGPPDLSTRYFLAAEHQLAKEKGSIRLASVQARLTQCFYLLAQSRINHCWNLFGTMSHLALAIGLNRNRRPTATGGLSIVEAECRRRTFWCAYTLDTYLSVALGRPRTFHDEDIDVELPSCINDDQLTADRVATSVADGESSVMFGPLAHMKLARIMNGIVRDLYSIKPISASRRWVLTERASKSLSDWRVEMSSFLDANLYNTMLVPPIFRRQRDVLQLTYWHATILAHRPFFLSNFARLSYQGPNAASDDAHVEESVRQCVTAAKMTVRAIDDIKQTRQMFRAFWITAYIGFTATIVLYLYVIQKRASPPDAYADFFAAATRCQSYISAMAEKGSLPERYCLVLEELRVETLRQTERTRPPTVAPGAETDGLRPEGDAQVVTSMPVADSTPLNTGGSGAASETLMGGASVDLNGMPSFELLGSSGWDQFVSMVSSGLGNFDLLHDESI